MALEFLKQSSLLSQNNASISGELFSQSVHDLGSLHQVDTTEALATKAKVKDYNMDFGSGKRKKYNNQLCRKLDQTNYICMVYPLECQINVCVRLETRMIAITNHCQHHGTEESTVSLQRIPLRQHKRNQQLNNNATLWRYLVGNKGNGKK